MSREIITNAFSGGLATDYSEYQTPSTVYTYAENITFVSHAGNELILQNEKGNILRAKVKENYVVLGVKEYGGIAYIVSAETIDGKFTGRGEIGSFPSPDYENYTLESCIGAPSPDNCNRRGKMTQDYRPFMNYSGGANKIGSYGEFNTELFNFKAENPFEIVAVQPSYDNTVNVIFTDFDNRPKIINSRFTVLPNNEYLIINRTGDKDDNQYSPEDFDSRLNHIITSNRLPVIEFVEQTETGKLPCGTYTYYFRYSTRDGNLSDVIGQSFQIPVYFGNTVRTTRGGALNENTNKANRIRISNLDPQYYALKVYFSYSAGEHTTPEPSILEIQQEFLINNQTSIEILHTGFEVSTGYPVSELSLTTSDIFTYRTGTELQGRLFVGNIKSSGFDYNSLRTYSSKIKVGYSQKKMQVRGASFSTTSDDLDIPIHKTRALDCYEAGYYNPANVHDYLGYWAGEPYLFAIEFKFKNGSSSPLFPVRGIDNLNDNAIYSDAELLNDQDFDKDNNYENTRGLYRFPARDKLSLTLLYDNWVSILHPTFEFPEELPEYIKNNTVGFRIHRAKYRKKDAVAQGILINTMIVPENDYVEENLSTDTKGGELTNYNSKDNGKGYEPGNSKFIPAPEYILEAAGVYKCEDKAGGTDLIRLDDILIDGIEAVKFLYQGYKKDPFGRVFENNLKIPEYLNKRYAFLTPEILGNKVQASQQLSGRRKSIYLFASSEFVYAEVQPNKLGSRNMNSFNDIISGNTNDNYEPLPSYFSLYKQISSVPFDPYFLKCELDFIEKEAQVPSVNRFAGRAYFQSWNRIIFSGGNRPRSTGYAIHPLAYNDYVGVYLPDQTTNLLCDFNYNEPFYLTRIWDGNAGFFVSSDSRQPTIDYQMLGNPSNPKKTSTNYGRVVAKHVNIYPRESGPVTGEVLINTHYPEVEDFTPITQWTYWSEDAVTNNGGKLSEAKVLSNNKIDAFAGDNYVSIVYRRLYRNCLDPLVNDGNFSRFIKIGHTISFAAESNVNVAFRGQEIFDVNEGVREFPPLYTKKTPELSQLSWRGTNHPWRSYPLLESEFYNTGYRVNSGDTKFKAISTRNPFVQTVFNTRIQYSELFVNRSFENGYRMFQGLNYRDYSAHLGDLVALRSLSGSYLVAVFEHGIVLIPVNQRIGGLEDAAGEVFFRSAGVLPPENAVRYISEVYGSRWQFSVIQNPNYIYGVDIEKAKIWRTSGSQLELISDFQVQKWLRSISDQYIDKKEEFGKWQIRSHYDKFKQNIIFSFIYSKECEDNSSNENSESNEKPLCKHGVSLIFNENPYNKWLTFQTIVPQTYFSIRDQLYSIYDSGIWQHYVNDKYSNLYGQQQKVVIEFVASLDAVYHVIYDNILIISNHVYPEKIEYTTDAGTFVQTISARNVVGKGSEPFKQEPAVNIFKYDAIYKEDRLYITIMKDEDDTRKLKDFINRRIRDKYCKIRITYNTDQYLYIKQLMTYITKSYA
ncbi:MAG: hypothetical protein NZZ41_02340 [Candidatus Dojkabacteria bacterium]|nr:hypothetical protein [Candidatus Dojkabacteria bacterium]